MPPDVRATPSPRRRWKRALVALTSLFVAASAAEIAFRVWLAAKDRPFSSDAAWAEIARLESTARDPIPTIEREGRASPDRNPKATRVLNPFWAWDHVGGLDILASEIPRIGDPALDDAIEIVIVGGSVAEMFSMYGREPLIRALQGDERLAERPIHLAPFGRGGYKQPQQLALVEYLLGLGYTPEVVLNIDGFNDVALAGDNARSDVHPTYPSITHWAVLARNGVVDAESIDLVTLARSKQVEIARLADRARAWRVPRSAIATSLVLRAMNRMRDDVHVAFEGYRRRVHDELGELAIKGPKFDGTLDEALRSAVRMWSESSRSLRSVCEARGIVYVHVLQPTLHDTPNRTMTAKEIEVGAGSSTWIDAVHAGYPLLRAAGAELAAGGERFLDGSPLFKDVEETVYMDVCHFRDLGNRLLAELAASEIAAGLAAK